MTEIMHKAFFDAHRALVSARDSINKSMRLLGEEAEHYKPEMEQLRQRVAVQRDALDVILKDLGMIRTDVIRKTGCDGSCSK